MAFNSTVRSSEYILSVYYIPGIVAGVSLFGLHHIIVYLRV